MLGSENGHELGKNRSHATQSVLGNMHGDTVIHSVMPFLIPSFFFLL